MGGYKNWVVTNIKQVEFARLLLLGGYYHATVTITGITVVYVCLYMYIHIYSMQYHACI